MSQASRDSMDTLYIKCACNTHMLEVSRFKDEREIYLSIWYYYRNNREDWKWRIKSIWRILFYGDCYADNLVLDTSDARILADELNKMADAADQYETVPGHSGVSGYSGYSGLSGYSGFGDDLFGGAPDGKIKG